MTWVFGYGSLIFRPDFPHVEREEGYVEGWVRRFWQGSTDHRGVPGAPGRVVTLVEKPGARCWGVAFRIADEARKDVLAGLDHREKGGYARHQVTVHAGTRSLDALVYLATADNDNYLGPAPVEAIADQIRGSRGPSGPNPEYVLRLADALGEMNAEDSHVFALADLLKDQR